MTLDRTIAPVIHDSVEFDYKLPIGADKRSP
jgi:hypothetical protein